MFYQEVVQEVLLLGAETWILLMEMSQNMERVRMGSLMKITGQKAKRHRDGT